MSETTSSTASVEQTAVQQTEQAIERVTLSIDPQALKMTEDVLGTQRAEIGQRIQATKDRRISAETQQQEAALAVQETATMAKMATARTAALRENLMWKADLETGNLSQWSGKGDFLRQGSGMYNLITFAHGGQFAVSLTIDTNAPSETESHAAYLFFWNQLPENAYYYSAWYFIPTYVDVQDWWTIMQWKSTYDRDPNHSIRVFSVSVQDTQDGLRLALNQRPRANEEDNNNVIYTQRIKPLPISQWFQIEAFYLRGEDNAGQVILWQDGVELYNLQGVTTVFSDRTIYWSVHNYSTHLKPSPFSIYIDDVAISKIQVGDRPLP